MDGHKVVWGRPHVTNVQPDTFQILLTAVVTHAQPENSLVRGRTRAVLVQRATSRRQVSRRALDVPIRNIRMKKDNRRARAVDPSLIYGLPSLRLNGNRVLIKNRFPTASRCVIARQRISLG